MSNHNIPTIKICVLGDGNVGKSALTIRYFQDQFVEDWDPTIEDLYTRKDIMDSRFYNLEVQDTAGQQNYEQLRDMYIRESQGFLIVFSVAEHTHNEDGSKKETSFDHVIDYYNHIREHHANVPILLVANKVDLTNMRKVSSAEIKAKAEQLNIESIETSAKTKQNVNEAFLHAVRACLAETAANENLNNNGDGENDDQVQNDSQEIMKKKAKFPSKRWFKQHCTTQ